MIAREWRQRITRARFLSSAGWMDAMLLLLTGDPSAFRRDLRELLERYGFVVAGEAPNGSSAVRLARELRPDLTMMDLLIPDMGGVEDGGDPRRGCRTRAS